MNSRVWLLALVVGLAGAGVGMWQLSAQTPQPNDVADWAEEAPTTTTDPANAVPPEEALQRLLDLPGVADVVRAIADADTDALVGLVDWQMQPCGFPHGDTT